MTSYYTRNILTHALAHLESAGDGSISREARGMLLAFGVMFKSSNFAGRPIANVETKRFNVAALHLEAQRLIVRVAATGERVTNYRLTSRGVEAAIEAVLDGGELVNQQAIRRGIEIVGKAWSIENTTTEGTENESIETTTSSRSRSRSSQRA